MASHQVPPCIAFHSERSRRVRSQSPLQRRISLHLDGQSKRLLLRARVSEYVASPQAVRIQHELDCACFRFLLWFLSDRAAAEDQPGLRASKPAQNQDLNSYHCRSQLKEHRETLAEQFSLQSIELDLSLFPFRVILEHVFPDVIRLLQHSIK